LSVARKAVLHAASVRLHPVNNSAGSSSATVDLNDRASRRAVNGLVSGLNDLG
jgi:hypothetical protein